MNKVLLDTNILIYSIDEESKYFGRSHKILSDSNLQLFTTSKNISEFLAVITRIPDKSLSIQQALMVVQDFKNIFTILYPTEHSYRIFLDLIKKYESSPKELVKKITYNEWLEEKTLNPPRFRNMLTSCLSSLYKSAFG